MAFLHWSAFSVCRKTTIIEHQLVSLLVSLYVHLQIVTNFPTLILHKTIYIAPLEVYILPTFLRQIPNYSTSQINRSPNYEYQEL